MVRACVDVRRGGYGAWRQDLTAHRLALPQLDRPANLTAQVTVAQLPEQDQQLPHGTQCLAMGWGRLGTMAPLPHILQELNVTVVTFLCRPENVCTFVPRRKAGICFVRTCPAPRALPTGGSVGAAAVQSTPSSLSSCRLCLGLLSGRGAHPL